MTDFYRKIETLMSERNLNVSKLANESGISRSTISSWREKSPTSDNIVAIAIFFDVSIDYLFGRTTNRQAHHESLSNNTVKILQAAEKLKFNDNDADLIIKIMAAVAQQNSYQE